MFRVATAKHINNSFWLVSGAPNGPSSVGSQTNTARWDREMARDNAAGPFRASSSDKNQDRQALTAALIHFSRALG